ncbi:MAG: histidine phosphatase family protein [Clostridia bacterium]|nr:histidine phosphatase family protein [Clostridia bacterium]
MRTTVYFVRHAQPDFGWADDRTRPLTEEGLADRSLVLEKLRDTPVDAFYSSPYRRSCDTVAPAAEYFRLPIVTDERFRERQAGRGGNGGDMFRRRWADFDFHEDGGECLRDVQRRNVAALFDLLDANPGGTVVVGTHGTALSTILNHFDPDFGCDDFLRIIDWMPYIVEMTFEGHERVGMRELGHVHKQF